MRINSLSNIVALLPITNFKYGEFFAEIFLLEFSKKIFRFWSESTN